MTRYSQNDEQDVILAFFGNRVGRFLDIGAFDGVTFSNTRALAERGWSGIMVEPDPFNLVKLIESVKVFDCRVEVWCGAAHTEHDNLVRLRVETTEGRGWASSIVGNNPGVLRELPTKVMVPSISIVTILDAGPFEFISIDAEWMDGAILRYLREWNIEALMDCELLSIEPRNLEERAEMKELLHDMGMAIHHETPENLIVRRQ